jgi:hypothetical protein
MCKCGCDSCGVNATPLMLNESLAPKQILSEGLKHHMDNNKPLTEHLYRAGSTNYFNLWAEARSLYSREILEITNEDDLAVLTETNLGHFGILEDGTKVPLDFPIELNEDMDIEDEIANMEFGMDYDQLGPGEKEWVRDEIDNMSLNEAKDKPLNKPMRDSSGGKAYKVYVKDPKTGNIKTVRFGSGGLRAKINDKEARNAFAARHKCSTKKDKTKAGYWSCRLPRYAKLLGLKSNFGGFW